MKSQKSEQVANHDEMNLWCFIKLLSDCRFADDSLDNTRSLTYPLSMTLKLMSSKLKVISSYLVRRCMESHLRKIN